MNHRHGKAAAWALVLACAAGAPRALADEPAATATPAPAPGPEAAAMATAAQTTTTPTAGDAAWPRLNDPDRWTVQIQPRAWFVAPSGRLQLPSTTTAGDRVRLETLNIDTPRISPYGEVSIRADKLRFIFSGAAFDIDRSATAGAAFRLGDVSVGVGESVRTEYDLALFQGGVGYRFYSYDFGAASDQGRGEPGRTVLHLEGLAGVRLYDLDITVSGPAAATTTSEQFFGEAFGGARAEFQIIRDFTIDLELTGGGYADSDRSVLSVDVAVGFTWRPVEAVGVQIGWRQLAFDLEDGEGAQKFEHPGRVAGVFFGLTLRF